VLVLSATARRASVCTCARLIACCGFLAARRNTRVMAQSAPRVGREAAGNRGAGARTQAGMFCLRNASDVVRWRSSEMRWQRRDQAARRS
jgi:hypothetical protein